MNEIFATEDLRRHTRYLYSYALRQVREPALAEDLVQETFCAALTAGEGFAGRSAVRTWLIGILKHKIVDAFRRRARDPISLDALVEQQGDADTSSDSLKRASASGLAPAFAPRHQEPEAAARARNLCAAVERQLGKLPSQTARAFVLSEILGHDTGEVCAMLGVSASNVWTMVHRARVNLRHALGEAELA